MTETYQLTGYASFLTVVAFLITVTMASTVVTQDGPTAEYHATERDVIVGDHSNTRFANRLLCDFLALHRQLGHVQEGTLDETCQRLLRLMQNGLEGVSCLNGKGVFVNVAGVSSVVASDDDASCFVKSMLVEAIRSPVEELEEAGEAESGSKADAKIEQKPQLDTNRPGDYDVVIPVDQRSYGNMRFHDFVKKYIDDGVVTIMAPPSARVKATILALRQTKNAANGAQQARFMRRIDHGGWTVLDDKESAEFVLGYVIDTLLSKSSVATFATADDLKSLIPSIGIADLSQFQDFSQPSTTPVAEPTEFDVLFGRGGMTNSHAGNKRFRDIISLHRPDYVRAAKIEKPNVARRIVAAIRGSDPPGRFMKRNPTDLMWYDVGNRHAAEKTSQALRERTQAEKNGMVAGTSETDVRKRLLEQALSEAQATRIRLSKDGGGQIGDCLDPTTFKLLVPAQFVTTQSVDGMGGVGKDKCDGSMAGASQAKDDAHNQRDGNKSLGEPAIRLDLVGEKTFNTPVSIDPPPPSGPVDENGDILVTENDILCGRGGLTNHHKGNKRFRDVVALHRPDYVRAVKVNKPAVARMIVKAIRNSDPPGRFLRKDGVTNKWVDIGDKRAAEKASQALREKPPEERTHVRQGAPEDAPLSAAEVRGTAEDEDKTVKSVEEVKKEATNGSSNLIGKNGEKVQVVQERSKRHNTEVNGVGSGKVSKIRCDTGS